MQTPLGREAGGPLQTVLCLSALRVLTAHVENTVHPVVPEGR